MTTILIISGVLIFIIFIVNSSKDKGNKQAVKTKDDDFQTFTAAYNNSQHLKNANVYKNNDSSFTVSMKGSSQSKNEREKYEEDVRRSIYEGEFQEKHATLLKVIFYIVRADSTFNKQEKVIVKELFEKLEENNQYLTDRFLEYVYRKLKVTSIQAFKLNVNKFLKSNEYDLALTFLCKKKI